MKNKVRKGEVITEEKMEEMKFTKKNFGLLQRLIFVQNAQVSAIKEDLQNSMDVNIELQRELYKKESLAVCLDNIISLREKKISLLKKKIEYLKFKSDVQETLNDMKNGE